MRIASATSWRRRGRGVDPRAHVERRLDVAVLEQERLLGLDRGDELLVERRLQVRVDRARVAGLHEVLGDADLVGDDPARLDRVVGRPARRAQVAAT